MSDISVPENDFSHILENNEIGQWAIEIDEGKEPRMFGDSKMISLLGLSEQLEPETLYHAWYDNVDENAYPLIEETIEKMTSGKHAEVQYPWHHPNGTTLTVRCGGVRNFDYTDFVRLEGIHQNITELIHYDKDVEVKEFNDLSLFIISALSDSYATLYYINSETSEYKIISRDEVFGIKVNSRLAHGGNFFEDAKNSIAAVIYEEDQSKIEIFTSKEAMENAFNGQNSFSLEYRIVLDGEPIWFALKAVKVVGSDNNLYYALGISRMDEQMSQSTELFISKMRNDALNFIYEKTPKLSAFVDFIAKRITDYLKCDLLVIRNPSGESRAYNTDGAIDFDFSACKNCPFSEVDNAVFGTDGYIIMSKCEKGFMGVRTAENCPAKSALLLQISSASELMGMVSVYFTEAYHSFTKNEMDVLKSIAVDFGLFLMRLKMQHVELAKIKAELSSKAKTEFLFNMSHDIRTPMNAILGYTDIAMRHEKDIDKLDDTLKKIKLSGEHLLSLINDVLEMSRIEAGKFEIVNKPVCLKDTIDVATNMGQALAMPKDIDFKTVYIKLDNPYVYADELRVNQVFINLISNAVKYTPNGGEVEFRIEQLGEPVDGKASYRFSVVDNGVGISEEFQKHLFENFSRETTSTLSRQEGTGLGLSIVKRIMDLTGGKISFSSKKDEGSTFIVEFTFEVMSEDAIETYRAEKNRKIEIDKNALPEGRRILIVEDNTINLEIASEFLKEANFEIESAEDGSIALDKIKANGTDYYDYVLMDIQMPVMNGYEATAEIRKLPGGDKVPIIALSANAFREDVDKSLANGLNAHVAKPIDMKELLSVMRDLDTQFKC